MKEKVNILPVLCRFQLGIQVEESLKILCTEHVPLKFLDQFDTYRIARRLFKNPHLAEYARTLVVKIDNMEFRRDEIEAEELKAEQEKQQNQKNVVELAPESPPDSIVKDGAAGPTAEVPVVQKQSLSPEAAKKLSLGLRVGSAAILEKTPDSPKEPEASQQAKIKTRKSRGRQKKAVNVPVQEMASATLADPVAAPETVDASSNDGFKVPSLPEPGRRGFNRRRLANDRHENSRSTSNSVPRQPNRENRGRGRGNNNTSSMKPGNRSVPGNRRGRGGARQPRARMVETVTIESDSSDTEINFTPDQIFDKYQLLYRTETAKKFPDKVNSKPEGETWIAYFKRLHRAEIEEQQDPDVVCLSGPAPADSTVHEQKPKTSNGFVVATDVEPNSSNEPSTSGRIPTFRVNPDYFANRHKYM